MSPRWGVRLLLLGGFLFFWPGGPIAYNWPKLAVMAAGAALAWIAAPRAAATSLDRPIAALLILSAVSAGLSIDPLQSVFGDYQQPKTGLLELALYACAFQLGAAGGEALADDGLRAWTAAAGMMGAFCLLQVAGLVPPPWDVQLGRALATIGSPIGAGACLAAALPLALSSALRREKLGLAAAPLALAGLALTRTRSAWLAAAAGVCAWLALGGRLSSRAARWAAGVAAAAAVAGALVVSAGRGQSDAVRVEIWKVGLASWQARPWLGWGPDAFSLAFRARKTLRFLEVSGVASALDTEAHDDLLQAAVTLGAAGLMAYLFLLWKLAAACRRRLASRDERASAAAGALVSAFLFAKLNPVPAALLTPCAWLAGWLVGASGPAPALRLKAFKVGSAALAVLFAAGWLADVSCGRALAARARGRLGEAREAIETATALAPWQLEFAARGCEIAMTQAQRGATRGEVEAFASSLLSQAERAARRHPGNPQAHELNGSALMFASAMFGPRLLAPAQAELELASRLDPTHPYPIQRRLQISRALKDEAAARRAEEELARIQAVSKVEAADRPAAKP